MCGKKGGGGKGETRFAHKNKKGFSGHAHLISRGKCKILFLLPFFGRREKEKKQNRAKKCSISFPVRKGEGGRTPTPTKEEKKKKGESGGISPYYFIKEKKGGGKGYGSRRKKKKFKKRAALVLAQGRRQGQVPQKQVE